MLEELSEHPVELLKPDPSAVNLTVLRGQQSFVFPSQFEADRTREAVRPTAHHPKQLLPCTDHFPFQLLILRERKEVPACSSVQCQEELSLCWTSWRYHDIGTCLCWDVCLAKTD